jgi:hypothetical protein
VAAVPFIAELARTAAARRAEFAWMLGMLADPRHASGESFEAVRAAVIAPTSRAANRELHRLIAPAAHQPAAGRRASSAASPSTVTTHGRSAFTSQIR